MENGGVGKERWTNKRKDGVASMYVMQEKGIGSSCQCLGNRVCLMSGRQGPGILKHMRDGDGKMQKEVELKRAGCGGGGCKMYHVEETR